MENEEKSFGELPTLGRIEKSRRKEVSSAGEGNWNPAESIGDLKTLKPEGIVDDGRTDRTRRWKAGETILGRYVVERELGEGGMGVVYECLDTVGGVNVAVKSLPPELSHNGVEMEEVRENFQLVYGLSHPNIAGVRQLERDWRGEYYLVMEKVGGGSLRKWMRNKWKAGGVHLGEAIAVLRQVASALDYAHGEKVVHRDVKPGNVMIDNRGRVKVLDFGLAAQIRTSLSRASHAYRGTSGTGPYMAPEQWLAQPQDSKTDQYALGVMVYEMLAGRLPFESPDFSVLKDAALHGKAKDIPGLPASAMGAIRRAMAKEPGERFPSCGEFVAVLAGETVPRKSKAAGWLAAMILATGLLAGGAWATVTWRENNAVRQAKASRLAEDNRRDEGKRQADEASRLEKEAAEREALKTEVYKLAARAKSQNETVQRMGVGEGQGFEQRLGAMNDNLEWGNAALQGQDIGKAKEYFLASLAAAGWVTSNAPLREAAIAKRQEAEEAKQKADGMEGLQWGEADYRKGQMAAESATTAFDKGDFKAAEESWTEAATAYWQSEDEAKARRIAQGVEDGRVAKSRGDWTACSDAADRVLALDAWNEDAVALKKEAEKGLQDAREAQELDKAREAKSSEKAEEGINIPDGNPEAEGDGGDAKAIVPVVQEAVQGDPAHIQSDAYVQLVQGDASRDAGHLEDALGYYQAAKLLYGRLAAGFPDWQPRIVRYRTAGCDERIAEIKRSLGDDVAGTSRMEEDAPPESRSMDTVPARPIPNGMLPADFVRLLLANGEDETALATARKARETAPDDVDLAILEGVALIRLQHYSDAANLLHGLSCEHPDNATIHANLGAAWMGEGFYAGARAALQNAIDLKPDIGGEYYYNLALVCAMTEPRDFDTARSAYRKARQDGIPPDPQLEALLQ